MLEIIPIEIIYILATIGFFSILDAFTPADLRTIGLGLVKPIISTLAFNVLAARNREL